MAISISESTARAKSRVIAIRLASLTLRCMENWRREAGNYDDAMILIAVVAITSERLVRGGLSEELEDLKRPLPAEQLGHCNVNSIAAATGLNRETVRRKVRQLVERGYLEKPDGAGIRFREGLIQEPRILALVRAQLEAVARTADQLCRDGVLE